MVPKPKFPSSLLCCIKGERRGGDGQYYRSADPHHYPKGSTFHTVHEGPEEDDADQHPQRNHAVPSREKEKVNRAEEPPPPPAGPRLLKFSLPNNKNAVELEIEEDGPEPGYARIFKTPKEERKIMVTAGACLRRPPPKQESSLVDGQLNKDPGEMAMIARVQPFKQSNGAHNGAHQSHHPRMRIEDVTDDPKYKDIGEYNDGSGGGGQEGSLIEYCRLDDRSAGARPPRHSVCEASSAVKAKQAGAASGLIYPPPRPEPAPSSTKGASTTTTWRSTPPTVKKHSPSPDEMANIIDVGVGQRCFSAATCNCIGFRPHQWRKVCVGCKCERSDHELGGDNTNKAANVYERLGIKPTAEMAKVMSSQRSDVVGSVQHGYSWVPPGLSRMKVEEYMSQLPNNAIPRTNSVGEKNRERQLMRQLPRQDLSIAYCKHLKTPVERRLYEEFLNARNEIALDIGYVCANIPKTAECRKCHGMLQNEDMAVIAPKLPEPANTYHPACFTCSSCDQLLVDLTYCVKDDKVYCERHFAELHKPRCSACDELIFAGEYTKAMSKDWHDNHFTCWSCDNNLTGLRYVLRDEHPYCIGCYESTFANSCDGCSKSIGIDSKDLSYKDKHWHEGCFTCSTCKVSLVDKPFGSKEGKIFCSSCYDEAFATRCDGCGEIFRAGMKKMEYKGKQWHDSCFTCAGCKTPIGTRSFIPRDNLVYCTQCHEEQFATRCAKCKGVITTGGVTYKDSPYHRDCFCCANCSTSLAGQRFTSKDDKPYCADCYGELFAKRCSACARPITGVGGAKFISFEGRNWHQACFSCSQCSSSLVGKGFISDGADILCPECAKARIMATNG